MEILKYGNFHFTINQKTKIPPPPPPKKRKKSLKLYERRLLVPP